MLNKTIPFMKFRYLAAALSVALVLLSLGSLAVKGLNFGLDFTGGALIEVSYAQPANVEAIRQQLSAEGYRDVAVQNFGSVNDVLIRFQADNDPDLGMEVLQLLTGSGADVVLKRNEYVGPQVGEELREQGGLGLLMALIVVMIYIAFRFQFRFSVGAVVALVHDIVIIVGFFSLFQVEFDLTVLAALLAIIGYSLNDTIVVSDRIREQFRLSRETDSELIMDQALTATLSRTLITSLTTALVVVALMVFGGQMIYSFAEALLIGIIVGTYSSIFVVTNVLLMMKLSREDLIPKPIEPEPDLVEEIPSWLKD